MIVGEEIKLKTIKIKDLRENPKNPKLHPSSNINQIVKSMDAHGYKNMIQVTSDNLIMAGHGRKKALLKKYKPSDEVVVIEHPVDDEEATAYMMADNKIGEYGEYDKIKLSSVLNEIEINYDLDDIGYNQIEVNNINQEVALHQQTGFLDKAKDKALNQLENDPNRNNNINDDNGANNLNGSSNESSSSISNGENKEVEYVTIAFKVTYPERDEILNAISMAKKEVNTELSAVALKEICKKYLENIIQE
jgi:hypothetical protein